MTSPDWLPLLRRAAGVVTDSGGMTCHAAIVSRELGIPCVVGTGEATSKLRDGEIVTVDATRGLILEGALAPEPARAPSGGEQATRVSLGASSAAAVTATQILVNLSEPSQVQRVKNLPVDGVGLSRAEMMVLEALAGDHPRTLLEEDRGEELVSRMAEGLSAFAVGFAPRPVTYRTIDFRTNEFVGLRGGERFEPKEANPMIGYRGALRYTREPEVFAPTCLKDGELSPGADDLLLGKIAGAPFYVDREQHRRWGFDRRAAGARRGLLAIAARRSFCDSRSAQVCRIERASPSLPAVVGQLLGSRSVLISPRSIA